MSWSIANLILSSKSEKFFLIAQTHKFEIIFYCYREAFIIILRIISFVAWIFLMFCHIFVCLSFAEILEKLLVLSWKSPKWLNLRNFPEQVRNNSELSDNGVWLKFMRFQARKMCWWKSRIVYSCSYSLKQLLDPITTNP